VRIKIQKLAYSHNGETLVDGDTGLGCISGLWRGKDTPVIGEDYDVELTLPDPAVIRIISDSQHHEAAVSSIGAGDYQFRGECEVVYEDGVIAVRFATNWIDLVGAENLACRVGDWVEFTIPRDHIEIYPIDG
jgi:hypothetical protein